MGEKWGKIGSCGEKYILRPAKHVGKPMRSRERNPFEEPFYNIKSLPAVPAVSPVPGVPLASPPLSELF